MIFIILLLIPLLIPINAHAIFQKIYKGYQVSDRLNAILVDEKIYEADYVFNSNKYDWSLDLSGGQSDSGLESLFSFQSQRTITQKYSVGLLHPYFHLLD